MVCARRAGCVPRQPPSPPRLTSRSELRTESSNLRTERARRSREQGESPVPRVCAEWAAPRANSATRRISRCGSTARRRGRPHARPRTEPRLHGSCSRKEREEKFHDCRTRGRHVYVPSLESMQAMMPAADLWPIDDMWGLDGFCDSNAGASSYTDYINTSYGTAVSAADYVRKSQMVNM